MSSSSARRRDVILLLHHAAKYFDASAASSERIDQVMEPLSLRKLHAEIVFMPALDLHRPDAAVQHVSF
jgi:hypothetical protein